MELAEEAFGFRLSARLLEIGITGSTLINTSLMNTLTTLVIAVLLEITSNFISMESQLAAKGV